MHEWASLNPLRYLSTIPDLLAADGFVFVSPRQRDGFLSTPWVSRAKKDAAPVIPIGPTSCRRTIDGARVAMERMRTRGEGALRADVVVGFFGVLYASKRPDLLLRVIASLSKRGVKARLLVCGDFLWDKPNDRAAFLALAQRTRRRRMARLPRPDRRSGRTARHPERVGRLPAAVFGWRQRAARQFPGGEPTRDSAGHDRARATGRVRPHSGATGEDRQSGDGAGADRRRLRTATPKRS